jgi:hypothetical protein
MKASTPIDPRRLIDRSLARAEELRSGSESDFFEPICSLSDCGNLDNLRDARDALWRLVKPLDWLERSTSAPAVPPNHILWVWRTK